MIPNFPEFTKLALEHRSEITAVTSQFLPYSDYNFTSLWSWNINEEIVVSKYNGFLVVRFSDYMTGNPVYGFIGQGDVLALVEAVFVRCKLESQEEKITFVPETTIAHLLHKLGSVFHVVEERDHHDYVLSVNALANLSGAGLHNYRNLCRRFMREHPNLQAETVDLRLPSVQEDVRKLFLSWAENKSLSVSDYEHEFAALERHFAYAAELPDMIHACAVYESGKMIGFASDEIISDDYALSHFLKAIVSYRGLYQYLWYATALHLEKRGIKYFNIEQDLGIPELRRSKQLWDPAHFLKKYTIRRTPPVGSVS